MSWKKILYGLTLFIVAGIAALSGAVVGGIAVYQAGIHQPGVAAVANQIEAPAAESAIDALPAVTTEKLIVDVQTPITEAVEKVGSAVVTVVGTIPGQNTVFGRTADVPVSGSGVIISEDGYIITNNHVVEDTQDVSVVFADGSEKSAEILGRDDFSDIAVLKVEGKMPAVAPIGNSDALKPGETAIAIGSPLGDFKNTVTVLKSENIFISPIS